MSAGANLAPDAQWSGNSTVGSRVFRPNIDWSLISDPYSADVWEPEFIAEYAGGELRDIAIHGLGPNQLQLAGQLVRPDKI